MERPLSYKKVDEYFEELATKNIDIKDYCGTSVFALGEKLDSSQDIQSPILVFFNYEGKLSGNQQRTFNSRSLSFSILFIGIKSDDVPSQLAAKNDAEIIGLEVLSRINVQSKMENIGWLYNNFDKDSVIYSEVDTDLEGVHGMEFFFNLKTIEPLIVNPDKWSDGNIFCTQ
ncbi:hypothetical protein [Flavobacterium sp. T12S277]|uniref:hypothetical protein n=1 Tax=Flavobacterium sp. T12S277 TaxID=3402752 RepID=UPI003ADA1004